MRVASIGVTHTGLPSCVRSLLPGPHPTTASVVRLSDILDRPERLSTLDSFHPGSEAYQKAARRIAGLLAADPLSVEGKAADASRLQKPPVVNQDKKRGTSLE